MKVMYTNVVLYSTLRPTICRLEIEPHFSSLKLNEKLYAHYISRAAFLGTRVTMRQISPESETIYDLIVSQYKAVGGDWGKLGAETGVSEEAVQLWLEYVAGFLGNAGNYKVSNICPRGHKCRVVRVNGLL